MQDLPLIIQSTCEFDGVDLHYWICGPSDAPWIVFNHGGALDHTGFIPTAHSLSDKYRILLWDYPGHGLSQPMPSELTIDFVVRSLCEILNACEIETAHLMGFSYGGVVSQVFADRYTDRCLSLTLLNSGLPYHMQPPAPKLLLSLVLFLERLKSWPSIKSSFASKCSAVVHVQKDVEFAMNAIGKKGFLKMMKSLMFFSSYSPGYAFRTPTTYLYGDQDRFMSGKFGEQILNKLRQAEPNMELSSLNGVGHCAHQERPELFTQRLKSAIDRMSAQ